MTRRHLILLLLLPLALATVDGSCPTAAIAKDSDRGGGDDGGRGGGDSSGRGGDDSGHGGRDDSRRGGSDNSGRGSGDDKGRDDNRGDDNGGRGRGRGGDDGGQGRGRGRGDDNRPGSYPGWGRTSSDHAREAVSQGWALALSSVLPTVTKAVPGKVLEVDLRQSWSGDWRYEFLVLTRDRRYQEVIVDARRNQILQIRRR